MCGLAVFLILPVFSMQVQAEEEKITEGVFVDHVDLSGMTKTEAQKALNDLMQEKKQAEIHLLCVNDEKVIVNAGDLGLSYENEDLVNQAMMVAKSGDIVTRYKLKKDLQRENLVLKTECEYDQDMIQTLIVEKCKEFDIDVKNYFLKRENGVFSVINGQEGYVIDEKQAVSAVYDFMKNEWDGKNTTIELPTIVQEPKGSASELAVVQNVLGSFSTAFPSSGEARVANIQNGCRLINGITLYPGEEYSTLEVVTPFSADNGYHMAGSYMNGMVVDSLGGGICQVSTTLYNAVLRAELEVTKRSNHSMSVSYVPLSADAAIAESAGKDFCFRNNTDYPVYIEGFVTPEKVITFNIYGKETREAGRTVDFVSEVLASTPPDRENIVPTSAQPIGFTTVQSAHVGYKSRLVKIVYKDGVEVSRQNVNNSNYKMVPRTLTVGTATGNPEHANALQAAIATGNIDHVRQVAGSLAAQEQVVETQAPEI